jgi:hypothetical protein
MLPFHSGRDNGHTDIKIETNTKHILVIENMLEAFFSITHLKSYNFVSEKC